MDIIAERKTKTVYKDDDTVVKLFVKDYSKADILNEALIHSRVEENTKLNIPKLLEVKKYASRWALTTEYIEGKTLTDLMKQHPEKQDEYLKLFVKLQLEVLGNTVPLLNRIKDKFRRKLTETNLIDENIKYELLQRLEGMKNHTKLCHGDFNPSNIIVKPNGECYILDWSHATVGNASADAARTFLIFSMYANEELANKYLDLFAKESKIEKSHIQRWIPLVAATQLTKGIEEEQEFLRNWIDIVDFE
ncbi:MAG: phosphotransferase [Clostridia bacterium]|nr:phosphotransferase [Clostridia bacterium]